MKRIIAGNWKLHKNPEETRGFFTDLLKKTEFRSDRELVFFPPATNLESTAQSLKAGSILWGSQNCCHEVKGAFTGEISAQTISYLGGHVVLIGHSERRTLFHETDELIAKKVRLAQSLDLTPYLCIGETLEERESGKTLDILKKQIMIDSNTESTLLTDSHHERCTLRHNISQYNRYIRKGEVLFMKSVSVERLS